MIGDDVLFASVRDLGAMLRARRISAVELTEACLARLETIGLAPRRGRHRHARARARAGPPREPGAARRKGPRSAPRHPVRGQGPPRDEGHPDELGRRAAARPGVRRGRDGRASARGGGGDPVRQARHGRARGRPRLRQPRRELHRPRPHAVEPRPLERRLVERLGGGGRRRPRVVRARERDRRLDPHAGGLLRRHRPAPDLRPRLAPRRDDALVHARQARADRAQRRRRGARARCHRRRRPRRPGDRRELPLRREEEGARRPRASLSDRRPAPRDRGRAPGREDGVRPCGGRAARRCRRGGGRRLPGPAVPRGRGPDRRRRGRRGPARADREREGEGAARREGPRRRLRDARDAGRRLHRRAAGAGADAGRARPAASRATTPSSPRRARASHPPIGRDFDAPRAGRARAAAGGRPGPAPAGDDPRRQPRWLAGDRGADRPRRGRPSDVDAALGRAFSEETLVAVADAYQRLTDWHRQRPPASKAV